jgi:hypothetical protein
VDKKERKKKQEKGRGRERERDWTFSEKTGYACSGACRQDYYKAVLHPRLRKKKIRPREMRTDFLPLTQRSAKNGKNGKNGQKWQKWQKMAKNGENGH